jgi:hypothetical protein
LAPTEADVQVSLSVPADLGGQVAFLGYRLSPEDPKPGDELTLTTAWRVVARPTDPALSMFAHVVGPEGATAVGDRLGFPAIQWGSGDTFEQASTLALPLKLSPGTYWVQVGLYSLATGDRLPVIEAEQPVSDRLLLRRLWLGAGG